jgi:hypothetical protein
MAQVIVGTRRQPPRRGVRAGEAYLSVNLVAFAIECVLGGNVKPKLFSIGILCGLALAGCNKNKDAGTATVGTTPAATKPANTNCDSPNDQDLEKSARCFHLGVPSDAWHFLSKEAQAEEGSREEFNKRFGPDDEKPVAFKVLGVDTRNGQNLGRIEVVWNNKLDNGKYCKNTQTFSWIQEGTSWRRLHLPKTMELNAQQFSNGDYSAALGTAEKWLAIDPVSLDAYKALVFALTRGGRSSMNTRSLPDTVRAALAVNPADSRGLFTAVTFTEDPDVAESLFDRISPDDCGRENAAFNLAMKLPSKRALEFLEKLGSDSSSIQMLVIELATTVGDRKKLESVLTADWNKKIRADLDRADGAYAAMWSVSMGNAWLALNKKDVAKTWASYAATRDPSQAEVARLLRKVRN